MTNSFIPCAIIPVYNHHHKIDNVLKELLSNKLHCIVVDDGSEQITRDQLVIICREYAVTLVHLPTNSGKGAAVMRGMILALEKGYTHAAQVDADNQHDLSVIPDLLEMAKKHPGSLVTGCPIYKDDAPFFRLYGRKLSQWLAKLETCSNEIKDPMIGFRCYPLKESRKVFERINIVKKMGFDIDIIVRLKQAGVSVYSIPVTINYPEDGISHFNMISDNYTITLLHLRLLCVQLMKLPYCIKRFFNKKKHWSNYHERGYEIGIRFLWVMYKKLGHRCLVWLLTPVVMYFFITSMGARRASRQYLENLYTVAPDAFDQKPNLRLSYKHFFSFCCSLVDRIASWNGDISIHNIECNYHPLLISSLKSRKGILLFVSHLGNIEVCRAIVKIDKSRKHLKINVLMHVDHTVLFDTMLRRINPNSGVNLIPVQSVGPDTVILLKEKIDQGEIVAIAADRMLSHSKQIVSVQFLGKRAFFPKGPFILANLLECPVFTVFCQRKLHNNYKLIIDLFANPLELSRREERNYLLAKYIQEYASRLEEACIDNPLDWFNFFDFWQDIEITSNIM